MNAQFVSPRFAKEVHTLKLTQERLTSTAKKGISFMDELVSLE